jgi:serine/threonine-protein kinase
MANLQDTVGGYRLRTMLQTGQFSQVYEVVEPQSHRHFAMKLLLPEHARKPEVRNELFHEAAIGVALRHENVIHILKVNRDPQFPHFIMEYFPSGSLRTRMMAKETAFIKENARKIFKHAATGLAYMHGSGYVHCDVKPENFLVNASGDLKLIDFAITKRIPTGFGKWFYRKAPKAAGTASYMAPEQILRERPDPRSDIYSLGITYYEVLTGRKPFTGKSPQELLQKHFMEKAISPQNYDKDITDEMAALILKMMAKKKEDRPKTCHDVMIALRKIKIYKSEVIQEEQQGMGMGMG